MPPLRQRVASTSDLKMISFAFLFLAVVVALAFPARVLYLFGLNYVTARATIFEKVHPSTYLIIIAFCVWSGQVWGEWRSAFKFREQRILIYYVFSVLFVFVYNVLFLDGQYAIVVDSWFAPAIFLFLLRNVGEKHRKWLFYLVHYFMAANALVAIYEYVSGALVIPQVQNDIVDIGTLKNSLDYQYDGRAAGLVGHHLSAATMSLLYIICCFANLKKSPLTLTRLLILVLVIVSMPTFGARYALLLLVLFFVFMYFRGIVNVVRTNRISQYSILITALVLLFAIPAVFVAFELDYFDVIMNRMQNDNGSADTRVAAIHILMDSSFSEIFYGDVKDDLVDKMIQAGALNGIEIFWVGFLLRYGAVCAVFYFSALIGVVWQFAKDLGFMGGVAGVFFLMNITGSLSLDGKTTLLSSTIIFLYSLAPRQNKTAVRQIEKAPVRRPMMMAGVRRPIG